VERLDSLIGYDLVCYCVEGQCHGQVLLDILTERHTEPCQTL
jgi:hypothetical protein